MQETSTTDSNEPPVRARRGPRARVWLFALAGCVIAIGLALRSYLERTAAPIDGAALPVPVRNAPFIVTRPELVERILELAAPAKDDVLYDLGCGDGRIVIAAAKKYGCRGVGFDIDPERIAESRANAQAGGVEDLTTFDERDIFTLDLSQADVVVLYLLPRLNARLVPQLLHLKPGARIVSHDFDLPGYPPDERVTVPSPDGSPDHVLYLWTAPLKPQP